MSDWTTFFAFPLNLLLACLWATGGIMLWKKKNHGPLVRLMLSPAATISALVLLLAVSLWMGFCGNDGITTSIPFALVLLYIQTVLLMVTLRGWKRPEGKIRWRFLLIHAGLLLTLGAGFWGEADSSEVRLKLNRGEITREAYKPDGSTTILPYEISLTDFKVENSEDGKPVHYEASISLNKQAPVKITVNSPHSQRFGEEIYLASVSKTGCILQIVHEPWKYFALAGIIMLLTGAFMLFIKGPKK